MRKSLGKQASLSSSQILAITDNKEAFIKAATSEAERLWNGFTKELRKQGANEDFISGMLKEAEETAAADPLGASSIPPLPNQSINTNPAAALPKAPNTQHQVIPHIDNKWTGALGGGMLMALLSRHMGLEGPAAWLLPVLGGLGGHHFFPKLMNSFKDAPGTGIHKIHPEAVKINQSNPLTPKAPKLPEIVPPATQGLKDAFSTPADLNVPVASNA